MKKFLLLPILLLISGCSLMKPTIVTQKVALLPEERIFTAPAGQVMHLVMDKKPVDVTFPTDMKVVSPDILVANEQKLNTAALNKAKSDSAHTKNVSIIGSIAAAISALLTFLATRKKQ